MNIVLMGENLYLQWIFHWTYLGRFSSSKINSRYVCNKSTRVFLQVKNIFMWLMTWNLLWHKSINDKDMAKDILLNLMIGVKISLSGKANLNIKTIRRQKKGRSCNKVLVAITIISILICFFLSLFELPWLLMEDLVDDCLLKTLWLASSHSSLVWASLNYFAKSRSLLWHVIRLDFTIQGIIGFMNIWYLDLRPRWLPPRTRQNCKRLQDHTKRIAIVRLGSRITLYDLNDYKKIHCLI